MVVFLASDSKCVREDEEKLKVGVSLLTCLDFGLWRTAIGDATEVMVDLAIGVGWGCGGGEERDGNGGGGMGGGEVILARKGEGGGGGWGSN